MSLLGAAAAACLIAVVEPQALQQAHDALDAWQLEAALTQAEALLPRAPQEPAVQILAAEVLHQRGSHLQALSLLRAAGARQDKTPIVARVEAAAAYAPHFAERQTAHFRIFYVDKDEIIATYAEPVLEAAYQHIGHDLQFLPAEHGEKIVVEIYPDAQGLAGATGLSVKQIDTSGTIAVCKFHRIMLTSPLATLEGYDWADTLAHELTHLIISKKTRNRVPVFLHEGIAKYFESRWRAAAGDALEPFGEKLLEEAVGKNALIPFARMHPSMALLSSQDETALAFAEVFTLIEFISHSFGGNAVAALLQDIGAHNDLDRALQRVCGQSLSQLETAWRSYLRTRPYRRHDDVLPRRIRLKGEAEPTPPKAPSPADKAARLAELLQLRGEVAAAVIEYDKALAKGAATAALVVRAAQALHEVGRDSDALKHLDKLLARLPSCVDAQMAAGRLRLLAGQKQAAQRHFEAVRLRNPYNPELHRALASFANPAREQKFAELCEHVRPRRDYKTPEAPVGEAYLSIVVQPWGPVRLDQETILAPVCNTPVRPGAHTVQAPGVGGTRREQSVTVGHDGHGLAVLR